MPPPPAASPLWRVCRRSAQVKFNVLAEGQDGQANDSMQPDNYGNKVRVGEGAGASTPPAGSP